MGGKKKLSDELRLRQIFEPHRLRILPKNPPDLDPETVSRLTLPTGDSQNPIKVATEAATTDARSAQTQAAASTLTSLRESKGTHE